MDACNKHRNSKDPQWHDAMNLLWQHHWSSREREVTAKYDATVAQFTRPNRKGKATVFHNWSGMTLRQMAEEVEHIEAYDLFYAELSSFAHVDVRLADRYLSISSTDVSWSQKASEYDVANVFRHAASFLTCFMELFGAQFDVWGQDDVLKCWAFA